MPEPQRHSSRVERLLAPGRTMLGIEQPEAGCGRLFVPGKAIEQGSKRHVGGGRMIEANKGLGPWRERVALAAHGHGFTVLTGAVVVDLEFVRPRPVSTPKSRTPAAIKKPDIDKLSRAILDALTGIAFTDDAQVTDLHARKRLAEIGETPGVYISVFDPTGQEASAQARAAIEQADRSETSY